MILTEQRLEIESPEKFIFNKKKKKKTKDIEIEIEIDKRKKERKKGKWMQRVRIERRIGVRIQLGATQTMTRGSWQKGAYHPNITQSPTKRV